mgnify:FL=1
MYKQDIRDFTSRQIENLGFYDFDVLGFEVGANAKWAKMIQQILKNIHLVWADIVET